jgi:hypothetical protein
VKLEPNVTGPGTLTLTGKGIVKRKGSSPGAGIVKLTVKAKGKAKLLASKGKTKVRAAVNFTAQGGTPVSARKTIVLKKRQRR